MSSAATKTKKETDKPAESSGKKKTLGRGLSVLFNEASENAALNNEIEKQIPASDVVFVDVGKVAPNPDQPRKNVEYEALSDLAQSIREKGILQPILVRRKIDKDTDTAYEIIAGERRWRAARLAQETKIPVLVKECDDQAVLEIALIENIQREELDPIEEANAYKELLDRYKYTQDRLAEIVGKNRATISHSMRLLTLPEKVQEQLLEGAISVGHAKLFVGLDHWESILKKVVRDQLNVRQTEKLIRSIDLSLAEEQEPEKKAPLFSASEVEKAKAELDQIKAAYSNYPKGYVDIKFDKDKGGSIQYNFKNLDDLNLIIADITAGKK